MRIAPQVGDDGKLTFVRKYDIDVGDKTMFWLGMVALQTAEAFRSGNAWFFVD